MQAAWFSSRSFFSQLVSAVKPGVRVQTAVPARRVRLRIALDVERNKVPGAQIVGVPAIADSGSVQASVHQLEVPRLSIRPRNGLGGEVQQWGFCPPCNWPMVWGTGPGS